MAKSKVERTIDIQDLIGRSACDSLLQENNKDINAWLSKGLVSDSTEELDATQFLNWLLLQAIFSDDLENIFKILMNSDKKFLVNKDPLILNQAILLDKANYVKELLASGFAANAQVKGDDNTHLYNAFNSSSTKVLGMLLEAGATIDQKLLELARTKKGPKSDFILKWYEEHPKVAPIVYVYYVTVGEGVNRQAKFSIDNANKKYTVDDVKQWFIDAKFNPPICDEKYGEIVLTFDYEKKRETLDRKTQIQSNANLVTSTSKTVTSINTEALEKLAQAQNDANLGQTLKILKDKNLILKDQGLRNLMLAYVDVLYESNLFAAKNAIPLQHVIPKLFTNLAFPNVPKTIENEYSKLLEDMYNKFQNQINLHVSEEKEKIKSLLRSTLFPEFPATNPKDVKHEWNVYGTKPEISDEDRNKFIDQLEIRPVNVKLSDDLNVALNNMSTYGAKLLRDLNDPTLKDDNKKKEIRDKVNTINEFITTILTMPHLTDKDTFERIKLVYLYLEKDDKNRSHGFYKVQSFFRGLSYEDNKKEKWYVKSTTGELMYHAMKILEKEYEAAHPKEDKLSGVGPSKNVR